MSFSEAYCIRYQKGMTLYSSEKMDRYGIANAFPARSGGVSEGVYASLNLSTSTGDDAGRVAVNKARLVEAIGGSVERTVRTLQVHGKTIRWVTSEEGGVGMSDEKPSPPCDGLITDHKNLTLMVSTADCPNILLYAPDRNMIGAVHAGWRGTALDITGELVRSMSVLGCDPADITAFLPPAIGACCFETDEDVPSALRRTYGGDIDRYIREISPKRYRIDLQSVNARSLVNNRVKAENIVICRICSCCHQDFYSHRRSGRERGLGASVIRIPL